MMLLIGLLACFSPTTPFSQPTPPVPVIPGDCTSLTLHDALHVGGLYRAATIGPTTLFLADEEHIEVIDRESKSTFSIPVTGEVNDLLYSHGSLWIAAGTGGIQRWTPNEARGSTSRWTVGTDIVSLALNGENLWAADFTGRVWVLPVQSIPSDKANSLVVDGWPTRVTSWGEGVLVHGDGGPLEAVTVLGNGSLATTDSSSVSAYSQIATYGDIAYAAHLNRIERTGTDPSASLVLPFDIVSIEAVEKGLIIIGDSSEVRFWPVDAFDAHHLLSSDSLGFDATGVATDANHYLFYGPTAARWYTKTDAQLTQVWRREQEAGEVTSLANHGAIIVVGTARPDGRGELIILERREETFFLLRRFSTSAVSDVNLQENRLIATTEDDGVLYVDLSKPPDKWSTQSVVLQGEELIAVTISHDDDLVVLSRQRGLIWLKKRGSRYQEQGNQSFYGYQKPVSIVGTPYGIAVGYENLGAIDLFSKPNTPPMTTLLAGSLGSHTNRVPSSGRLRQINGKTWALSPELGLQAIDAARGTLHSTMQVSSGAWDISGSDSLVATALGRSGVGIINSIGNGAISLSAVCDTNGHVTRVAVDGAYVIATTGSTLSLYTVNK